jgi:hypothetical protein
MLTFVESISLAGDRAKQNDDACGFRGARAWVLDGATDLHGAPLTGWKSDASWIAHFANARLYAADGGDMRNVTRDASVAAKDAFSALLNGRTFERWQSPISSLLMVEETGDGVAGIDLGDSRAFALDASGVAQTAGGPTTGREAETKAAAQQTDADKPLLERTATIEMLRRGRSALNQDGAHWTFGIDPKCADHARAWSFKLSRPAHVLLMTDGFAALTDQYGAYDAAGLVRAALDKGLQELGRELRAIEAQDSGGTLHPRFKKSDDATALLLRLS